MITSCSAVGVISIWLLLILLSTGAFVITESRRSIRSLEEYASIFLSEASADSKATRWAVLVAGSNGYENYRHQADICHAYQILKNGGLNDENIIVFMYDDIAYNEYNPTPGMVVNKPYGPDVYQGVPKDYTGNDTTAHNLYAVLLGKKQELTAGSGKVLESGPGDHVFFYYADHGSTGIIGMPVGEPVYAQDLIVVLEQMHEADMYKKMVIYVEACESGSMFNGLLSDELGIYTTTASDPYESSWATYCPDDYEESESTYYSYSINSYETTTAPSPTPTPDPGSPEYYGSCLGDMYSISWLEDCDVHDLKKETFKHQYKVVKKRTNTSHVMEYGNKALNRGILSTFMGSNPSIGHQQYHTSPRTATTAASSSWTWRSATQRDAKLIHLKHKIQTAPAGSPKRLEAEQRLRDEISGREEVDHREDHILKLLFGDTSSSQKALNRVRGEGQPVVDDWECFKTQVKTYEEHCGAMSEYGKKYTAVLAQLCNAGVPMDQFASASFQACSDSSK